MEELQPLSAFAIQTGKIIEVVEHGRWKWQLETR
jgi:hypothetical protein